MTRKVYKTAQGKIVDLGALLLQNENVRAVGNMNVNARGDVIDGANRIIDQKNRQIQRQQKRQTNVSKTPVSNGTRSAKIAQIDQSVTEKVIDPVSTETTDTITDNSAPLGGLAAAIARNRAIKQELEKTPRQKAQEASLKKI
jgi:hypothetical protein